jgi:signal transduction histidine kinase
MNDLRERLWPGSRLFWRVLLYGLGVAAATAATVGLVTRVLSDPPPFFDIPSRYARLLEPDCATSIDRLQRHLDELTSVLGDSLAVFAADGTRLAAAGPHVADLSLPADAGELGHPRVVAQRVDGRPVLVAPMACRGGAAFLLVVPPHRPPAGGRLVPTLVITLAFLCLGVFLLARTIAGPLARITRAVNALGRGDLSARTGLTGGDEIAALAKAFDEMAERLQILVRRERELLANVSHEIRTPLARVAVALELCDEDDAGAEVLRRHLEGIRGDVAELNRLLEDVLLTARLDLATEPGSAGVPHLERQRLPLDRIVSQALERFARERPAHEVTCELPGEAVELDADPVLLRRVLDNLLENAARYAGASAPIEVAATSSPGRLVVEVRDRGPGVDEVDLARLFEPFFRSEQARARYAGGLGLGLALCRRVVEAHGGAISALRREGGGLIVRLDLPRA